MQSFTHLSDDELVPQLTVACADMRHCKVRVLAMLAGIEERKIYVQVAASSMWDYARRFLRMSHGTAYRFIAVARKCRDYPFLLERIERGEVHISTIAHIASWITPENVEDLVAETVGKNRAHVDLILGRRFGVERVHGRRGGSPLPCDEELLRMVERAQQLMSHRIPSGDRLEITKCAYSLLIDTLEKKTRAKAERPRPAPAGPTKGISRHATRAMFERHGDQCCFVDERTGARCPSRAFIQRDHVHMRAHGGSDDAENLRPLCQAHNLWLAEMALGRGYLGRGYVERRIRFRQGKRTTTQGHGVR